jgi:sortase A
VDAVDRSKSAGTRTHRGVRILRAIGTTLVVLGLGALLWAFVIWRWNDPFTSLYTRWQQHKMASVYQHTVATYHPKPVRPTATAQTKQRAVAAEASRYRRVEKEGTPIGRIYVPRLGLHMLLVNGTDHDSLVKGPGRDLRTYMPGQGQLVYVAGHRTTYLAPFAHIDSLKSGDPVTLKMPYATFAYTVTGHVIVDAHDLSLLRSHNREQLALQACHPRFFATQRYVVYAKLVRVTLPDGHSFRPVKLGSPAVKVD